MLSDADLTGRLRQLLTISDLNTSTTASIRRMLEQEFGVDLTDKKAFIRQQIDLYLETQQQNEEGDNEEEEEQDEVEEEAEEEESNGKTGGSRKRGSRNENKEVKKKGGGFTKLCTLSPQLQKFTGVPELARTEVVKQLWSYIREHDLQDPANKRNIRCDEPLRELFDVDTIDMFQMNKALAKHIWPLNSDGGISSYHCSL
ncbi:putative transcription regulator SWI/SNF-BAF60b family [Helianthus annuus]|uniref:Transcription regulator SWI/SNF-BAF60b family n=2 Tax=Helianthus annuus TaxID=4232 RepID=A0A9K3HJC2_HELAN|nr:putative transcription regulator SWI/SNF-BAF60b family [Helianthus annuus]KAJ0490639.1 putative transcription regulator SWI/SNF-BAF60b family [Helianthus annuus]KAJ0506558.1 putative transcription regulator SWI/SNF-BAF60b family [Helianthus annuus]KAJ0676234.1 putative transcription regulator SWI/SNF-BAF60b family [Helianthus annuus]KAJ0679461.1 putative transcription regulator SWI/SNF-BAF60b family [Helianthus annuus]